MQSSVKFCCRNRNRCLQNVGRFVPTFCDAKYVSRNEVFDVTSRAKTICEMYVDFIDVKYFYVMGNRDGSSFLH